MKNRISELRKKNHLSQRELAAKLGISTSAVGMYEQGRREPDTKMLLRLAHEFNVTVDYLICANNVSNSFDIEAVSKDIVESLIGNRELFLRTGDYTEQELSEFCRIIEDSVKMAFSNEIVKE